MGKGALLAVIIFFLLLQMPVYADDVIRQTSTICFNKDDCICSPESLEILGSTKQQCNDLSCSWARGSGDEKTIYSVKVWREYNASYAQQELRECKEDIRKKSQELRKSGDTIIEETSEGNTCRLIYSGRPSSPADKNQETVIKSMIVYQDFYTISVGNLQYRPAKSAQEAKSYLSSIETCMKKVVDRHRAGQIIGGTDGEKKLYGTVTTGLVNRRVSVPMKHVEVSLNEMVTDEDWVPVAETTTNAKGEYVFQYAPDPSKRYGLVINHTYKTDKSYFSILIAADDKIEPIVMEIDDVFAGRTGNDVRLDIDLDEEFRKAYKDKPWWDDSLSNPFSRVYVNTAEALEFYQEDLGEDIHLNLPLNIIMYVDNDDENLGGNKAIYWLVPGRGSTILIGRDISDADGEFEPTNREYHEFSHYAMTNALGRFPVSRVQSDIPIINHDGYINPSTTDSWTEGFAHFMALVIADKYGRSCGVDIHGYHEVNWDAWDLEGKAEELAVSGVLWDLYDGKARDDACMARTDVFIMKIRNSPLTPESIRTEIDRLREHFRDDPNDPRDDFSDEDGLSYSIQELWPILRQDHSDFTSVYDALVRKYPQDKKEIDFIFDIHGFYVRSAPGDGKYTNKEPYRDANKNGEYEQGEYFIDLPREGASSDLSLQRIGTATNLDRLWRRSTPVLPGHYIRVNNAVPDYLYIVEFPGTSLRGYYRTVQNNNGVIYVVIPPEPGATITVTPVGVTSANPLIFTSDQFNRSYMTSVKQGYYTSHDFGISGPVPTPRAMAGFGSTGSTRVGLSGLFSVKGPLFDLIFGHSESRVPLIVSVPIIIAALLVLAYVLKKGE